jgi:hypothetical protein
MASDACAGRSAASAPLTASLRLVMPAGGGSAASRSKWLRTLSVPSLPVDQDCAGWFPGSQQAFAAWVI